MVRKLMAAAALGSILALWAGPTLATIHPIVESFDCANEQAFAHHPLGDPAEVPGQTPGYTPGDGNNELRALYVTSKGFTDFSSPAWFGHKLDGACGVGAAQ